MNPQFKKLVIGLAVAGAVLAAGTFLWINHILRSAEQQVRASVSQDESVRGRVLGFLAPVELTDRSGSEFQLDQLEGKVWLAGLVGEADPDEFRKSTSGFRRLVEDWNSGDPLTLVSWSMDEELDSAEKLAAFAEAADVGSENNRLVWDAGTDTNPSAWGLTDLGFDLDLPSGEGGVLKTSSECFLVDHYLRVRGKYDMTDQDSLDRLMQDIEIVQAEKTPYPEDVLTSPWMAEREKSQLATIDQFEVYCDFKFTDMQPESGIRFRNKIVDDAGRTYVASHYDHGNGVVVADVDGDDRLDIYFVNQAGRNELWRNLGSGRFEDITDKAGVAVEDRIGVTASFADIDNDGDADLFVTSVRGGNLMFENDGSGQFTDVTESSGLAYTGHSSSAVFFDYNRDGLLDLFLTNVGRYTVDEIETVTMEQIRHETPGSYKYYAANLDAFGGHLKQEERGEASLLYKNLGDNEFVDVSEEVQLVDDTWCGDATPVDFNKDGWPDLYVLNMQGHDEYYVNVEGKHFERKSREVFPMTPWGSMGVKAFDFDNDDDMDLLITDMHSDMSQNVGPDQEKQKSEIQWPESFTKTGDTSIWGNAFFRNEGQDQFEEVSDPMGVENYWPWGLSVGDLNADGYEDVFITASMNYPFRYGVNSLLLNNRGKKFLDSEFIVGVEPRRDGKFAEPCFEIDAESNQEIRVAQGRTGRVAVWAALGSRSSVIFDLDDDGDLDIVTNENNSWPMVLISNLAEVAPAVNYLKIQLVGEESNRDALGAVVRVKLESQTLTRVNDGQSGYMSQSRYPLYVGLGEWDSAESIEVTWPSGAVQTVAGPIQANQKIKIIEKSGE